MRLIVCGSRGWTNRDLLWRVLDEELDQHLDGELTIIEGEASGADVMARQWAILRGVEVERFPADWDRYGRSAGHRRNAEMLASGADGVFAFSSTFPRPTPGTAGMCRLAYNAGVVVCLFYPDGYERKFVRD